MRYEKIEVQPLSGALGAMVQAPNLGADLDNSTWSEIHRAFLDHLVLTFPNQPLNPEGQKRFSRRLGPIGQTPYIETMPDHPEIIEVRKEPHNTRNFGNGWHTDFTFLDHPPLATVLHAKEVPPYGGDTLYANMYLAYDALSPTMRRMLDPMIGIHCAMKHYGPQGNSITDPDTRAMVVRGSEDAKREVEHPVVRTHPETGRKCLFVNASYTTRFKDMTEDESASLLRFLYNHSVRPEFTCRVSWGAGTLTVWDNRCTQHYAINDYQGFRRVMHRITVEGDRPR